LRQFGQEVIEALGGKKVHPAWAVPGGVRDPLTAERRDYFRGRLPEARQTALAGLDRFKRLLDDHRAEAETFGKRPSPIPALVRPDGGWEHHDGVLRIVDANGAVVADRLAPARYTDYLGESVEHDSFLKSPYYKPLGYPDGLYRVGPLARLNVCTH